MPGLFRRNPVRALLAHSYRVPYCVPFWTAATYRELAACLATARVRRGPHVKRLEERISSLLAMPSVLACGSGTTAIELALQAAAVGAGDEVVMPTFCCESVIRAVLAVGATPVLVDVGDELNLTLPDVEAALGDCTRAVIVPHLFGNPAAVDAISELCRPRGIAVIDDAAQALGATIGGRPVATFGDAGVLSFGNGKVCFGTGGGVLVSRNSVLVDRAAGLRQERDEARRGVRDALAVLVWRRWRWWSLPVRMAIERVVGRGERSRGHARGLMRNIDAAVALTLVEGLGNNLRARRERAAAYRSLLEGTSGLTCIPHRPGSACLTQVVHIDPSAQVEARDVIAGLRASGVEAHPSYVPLHLLTSYNGYARGSLRNAEAMWSRVFELPCEPSVNLAQVERIAAIVRRIVA